MFALRTAGPGACLALVLVISACPAELTPLDAGTTGRRDGGAAGDGGSDGGSETQDGGDAVDGGRSDAGALDGGSDAGFDAGPRDGGVAHRFQDFVAVADAGFVVGGRAFRFVGATEALLMRLAAARASDAPTDPYVRYVESILDTYVALGFSVIRTFADAEFDARAVAPVYYRALYPDGGGPGLAAFTDTQRALHLSALDFVLARAEAKGLRVVLVLYQPWPASYEAEAQGSYHHEALKACAPAFANNAANVALASEFWTNPACVNVYTTATNLVLFRANPYKHTDAGAPLPYRHDPTILGWDLINEPANYDPTPGGEATVRSWLAAVLDNIRTHVQPRQLLTASLYGDDLPQYLPRYPLMQSAGAATIAPLFSGGAPRTSMAEIFALPGLDYADIHVYANQRQDAGLGGNNWQSLTNTQASTLVYEAALVARAAGKPFVVSEFGVTPRVPIQGSTETSCDGGSRWRPRAATSQLVFDAEEFLSFGLLGGAAGMLYWRVIPPLDDLQLTPAQRPAFEGFWCQSVDVDWNVHLMVPGELGQPASLGSRLRAWAVRYADAGYD